MNEMKRCPACNEQVPALAVRCKFCGVRLNAGMPASEASVPPTVPPSSSLDDDLDLDTDLDDDELLNAPMPGSPRVSAPPPARSSYPPRGMETAPPEAAHRSSAPPPPAPRVSAPPLTVSPFTAPPPPPPPISVSTLPPKGPVFAPPMVAVSTPLMPPMAAPSPRPTPSAPPPTGKRTMLGMAPVVLPHTVTGPGQSSVLPRPSAAPASTLSTLGTGLDDELEPTPLPSAPQGISGNFLGDDFDSLDLDGDVLDDDIDEISKFTEQTAITDVSTLARGMSRRPVEALGEDISPDLLDEIMDSTPLEPTPPPTASDFLRPPSSRLAPVLQALPTAVNLTPLGPMLESDTETRIPRPAKRGGTNTPLIVIGALVLAAGGFVAYGLLSEGTESEKQPESVAINQSAPVPEKSAPPTEAKDETKPEEAPAKTDADKDAKFPEHKCKSLSDYPSFAWRNTLDALAGATEKTGICGLFGLSKEAVVTAMRDTPNFGPTGYDLLPRSTVFEVFPEGKAERRAPSMELLFMDDLLYEIRMKFGMSNGEKLDPNMFKAALGTPKSVNGDPLEREIKSYTDGDMILFWYKKTDAFNRVFNEVVFSSRIIRAGIEKELKQRSEAQILYEQGMALYNQKQLMRAVDKFKKARKIIPAMGSAYIFEGIALLQNEQFDQIEGIAAQAFQNSTDDRARAGAKGLQAVVALYNGDKETALALFKNADGLDPADPEFATSIEELKSGNYDPARVAKTAARMDCRHNRPEWSVKGLLARGNFPDNNTFQKAKKEAKKKAAYKSAFDMWNGWECR